MRASRLPGRTNRVARMWVAGGSLGAGLTGRELVAARTGDLVEIADGRLAVQTRGRLPRLVPIRGVYTELVWEAIGDTSGGWFVTSESNTVVHSIAERLDRGNGKGLSLRPARSTWLLAHIVAGTSLDVIRHVAGSLSGNTLTELLQYTNHTLDDETAALGALGA